MSDNVFQLVERGDGPALVHDGRRISYAELRRAALALAGVLQRRGVGEGDVVSIVLPNCPAFVVTYLACWYTGAVANPLNTRMSPPELAALVRHAGSALVVTGPTFAAMVRQHLVTSPGHARSGDGDTPIGHAIPIVELDSETDLVSGPVSAAPLRSAGGDRAAVLVYTSGTTSTPKGVLLSHANLLADANGIAERLGVAPDYRTACIMPLFHCNALVFSHLSTFAAGGSVVLLPKFSASRLWDDIETHAAHSFSCPPTVLAILLQRTDADRPTPPSLRFVKVGAAPLAPKLAADFEARFGVPLVEGYGMTEGTATSLMHDPRVPRPPGTVGYCLPGQRVRIVDEQGRPVPAGTVGDVEIGGATVMLGYHRNPDLTAATVVRGWLRTGDLGSLGQDGYLRLAGRRKELIIRGGENIFPTALDQVLEAHPRVREGAAYAVPDPIWGESPAAAVVAEADLDLDDLAEFVRSRVADYAVPVAYRVVDQIPRNAVGKIQRHALQKRHELDLFPGPDHSDELQTADGGKV